MSVFILIFFLIIQLIIIIYLYFFKSNINKLVSTEISKFSKTQMIIKDFDISMEVLQYFLNISYDYVYQQDLVIFEASNSILNADENLAINSKFLETFSELLGPNLYEYYSKHVFGDDESFVHNVLILFNNKMIESNVKTIIQNEVNNQ